MAEILNTDAERRAVVAESLPAFSGLKLSHVKSQLTILLGMIGREGIFDEYTRHDISHINKMLGMLDWLIPEETKTIMSPADWLMTVLAIYLHDLGMLVTKREYEERNSSGFPNFRDNELYAGDKGEDYRTKVEKLGMDRAERFAYQEFVRNTHAQRIRAWIMGQDREHLGISHAAVSELDKLLSPLTEQFRRDLALVCESHHLNDLDDVQKYRISQPYGDSDDETVNLQYAAVLMRTADLLHITSDRTPSISYRVINPTDPISQEEWAKQMAVTRVRSQIGRDKDDNPIDSAPRDTLEVHAYFKKVDGFFGLSSYLGYAVDQLQNSYEWVLTSNTKLGTKHKFPWRYIDERYIETEGFIKQTFEFTFDQARILDLLTGHTLYNDIKVVLRELVQNAIDAVRLQQLINEQAGTTQIGKVSINWDSASRVLTVEDNGTGMTQSIVERNLLKVGASRYQDEDFRSQYPAFSSISRFGIGILSTFMIADSVEIVTCHPDDDRARQLSLRSVHGKYLIKLLDKYMDEEVKSLAPHGTRIQLKVRHSTDMSDVVKTAKRWIVIPNCDVTLSINSEEPIKIGFDSPKEAVADYLHSTGIATEDGKSEGKRKVRVIEHCEEGVTLAYAVQWSEYFKEWSFIDIDYEYDEDDDDLPLLGTCVEGIRVEFNTPGFNGYSIVALANAVGITAPKTNVARSGLEATPERDDLINNIYSIYRKHIANEIKDLYERRSFSLTWATQESKFLVLPLISPNARPVISNLLYSQIKELPMQVIERGGKREAVSPALLQQEPHFWTIDCAYFRYAEELIREMIGNASLSALVNAFDAENLQLPNSIVLCGVERDRTLDEYILVGKEVIEIQVYQGQRRVDLLWGEKISPPRWRTLPRSKDMSEHRLRLRDVSRRTANVFELVVGQGDIKITGISDEVAVRALKRTYILPNTHISTYLNTILDKAYLNLNKEESEVALGTFLVFQAMLIGQLEWPVNVNIVRQFIQAVSRGELVDAIVTPQLIDVINKIKWSIFDPSAWSRSSKENDIW